LYGAVKASEVDMPGTEESLLSTRNENWIPVIQKESQNQSIMYAVGAAHLAGEQGVIALLRKQGYTVTAINNK
jgi:uncharacterized protein